ncbi:MAG TPA: type II toxin-antitoxin system HicB family antitoxin [bacterium]|nr:type II toxin-antitoxin system HicB family antitoxin [bacterium]
MTRRYGYYFAIMVRKGECGYIAYAPGVGGVYEEGETKEEAKKNAYEAACAILETRLQRNDPIVESNKYLRVITSLPNFKKINQVGNIIPNGYFFTPFCAI